MLWLFSVIKSDKTHLSKYKLNSSHAVKVMKIIIMQTYIFLHKPTMYYKTVIIFKCSV